jgi:hypothetical protein
MFTDHTQPRGNPWYRNNEMSDLKGAYLVPAMPNHTQLATEGYGKTRNIRSFFLFLPCDSVAIYHAWDLTKYHSCQT